METCIICGNPPKTKTYCELCHIIAGALHINYTTTQVMALFSHVIGIKITQEITDNMYSSLKDQYEAEKLKEEDKLN